MATTVESPQALPGADVAHEVGPMARLPGRTDVFVVAIAEGRERITATRSDQAARSTSVGWMDDAACRGQDPELFFPIGTTGPGRAQVAQAKSVCSRCRVRADCLSYALTTGQDTGVWGGLSEQERRALRRGQVRRTRAT